MASPVDRVTRAEGTRPTTGTTHLKRVNHHVVPPVVLGLTQENRDNPLSWFQGITPQSEYSRRVIFNLVVVRLLGVSLYTLRRRAIPLAEITRGSRYTAKPHRPTTLYPRERPVFGSSWRSRRASSAAINVYVAGATQYRADTTPPPSSSGAASLLLSLASISQYRIDARALYFLPPLYAACLFSAAREYDARPLPGSMAFTSVDVYRQSGSAGGCDS
ncbi:hypothetical protein B0H11DRAFT_2406324 [Mycena galericulata]|nr:hypothetical protein B0H11DRAFT_2406324 [Mycena galericulata]